MVCDKCGEERDDAIARTEIHDKTLVRTTPDGTSFPVTNPVLCTRCCASSPGREWMRASAGLEL